MVVVRIRLKFEPRDLWIGAFWRRTKFYRMDPPVVTQHSWHYELFVCLLPCLPIVFSWDGK